MSLKDTKVTLITRIDGRAGHGWYFRVSYAKLNQVDGLYLNKYFNDSEYGGMKKSLQAAKLYKDEVLSKLPAWRREQIEKFSARKKKDRSGVVNIIQSSVITPKGTESKCWKVLWVDKEGRRATKSFTYGGQKGKTKKKPEEALQEAINFAAGPFNKQFKVYKGGLLTKHSLSIPKGSRFETVDK